MPLILPEGLINPEALKYEKIFTMDQSRADSQDIRPLKIAIVNLMPKKEETELQLLRMLSNTALQMDISLIHMGSYESKNTSSSHLEKFYKTYDQIKSQKFDAMIITGAPVERLEYEEIIYWPELKDIFEFARNNVFSTMFICWSAQAALHYFYGIGNNLKEDKIFGIYDYENIQNNMLTKGFDDIYSIPQSRYTYVSEKEVAKINDIEIIASRKDTGLAVGATKDYRFVFSFGHWEYDRETLHNEYLRDLIKEETINIPVNYYKNDNPNNDIIVNWRSAGNLFFSNWINYCVYQETPFNIEKIQRKKI